MESDPKLLYAVRTHPSEDAARHYFVLYSFKGKEYALFIDKNTNRPARLGEHFFLSLNFFINSIKKCSLYTITKVPRHIVHVGQFFIKEHVELFSIAEQN